MRINGFRCDTCCKEHLVDPTLILQSYREALPAAWFMVSQGPYKKDKPWDQQEPLLFCSVACLAQWAEKQATLVHDDYPKQTAREAEPALDVTLPVTDYIQRALQQLGEASYKRLMHGNWQPGDEE